MPSETETTLETRLVEPRLPSLLPQWRSYLRNEAVHLAISQIGYVGSSLLVTIAAGWWIAPEQIGVWRVLALAEAYAAFATFGIPNGFLRQFPITKGSGNNAGLGEKIAALYFSQITQALIGIGILVYLAARSPALRLTAWLPMAVVAYALYLITTRLKTAAETYLRADGQFRKLSRTYVILALIRTASLVLIPLWGFKGFLIRWPLSMAIEWITLQYVSRLSLSAMVAIPSVGSLIELGRDGVPSLIIMALAAFSESLDRTWLAIHANTSAVGHYLIADSVKLFFATLLGSIALVQYNRCAVAFGARDFVGIRRSVMSAARLLAIAYGASALLLVVCIITLVPIVMPKFVAGIPASLVILTGGFGLTIASLGFPLTVKRRYGWIIAATLLGLGAQFLCQLWLTRWLAEGVMVAAAWSVGQMVTGIFMLIAVMLSLKAEKA